MSVNHLNRRQVIGAAVAAVSVRSLAVGEGSTRLTKPLMCLFSKPLGGRKFEALPAVLNELDIGAVDLTCRPGGHVLPERVTDDLPKAVEVLKAAGVSVPMITTGITDAGQDHAEAIVKTAARLGIRYAKVGYYPYKNNVPILQTLAEAKAKLRDVAALFKDHGVLAGYHNHSGGNVGAPMWDLWQMIQELSAEAIGSYFDLGHATVEGGLAGWKLGLELLSPRVVMLAVKDMKWEKGNKGWDPAWGPLGEGMVPWRTGLAMLKKIGFAGPISLHIEYGGEPDQKPGSEGEKQTLARIRRDWKTLREWLSQARLS